MKFFKKAAIKISQVGLDIGTSSIKAAELVKTPEGYKLVRFGIKDIISQRQETLSDDIKNLLDESGISAKELNISFSGPNVVVRFIPMPQMSPEDLKSAIRFEGEKYIPFNMDEIYFDSCVLQESTEEKAQMLVLLAAAKKNLVDDRIQMLKSKGSSISIIDIDTFALFNAFTASQKGIDANKSIALLNMGASQTGIIFFKGGIPYFTRDIQLGGRDLDKAISKNLGMELAQAAALRRNPKGRTQEIFEASKNVLNNVVDEIRLSFGYYENQFGKNIDEIYLSGGLAYMQGLTNFLEENIGLKTAAWDPFGGFELDVLIDKEKLDTIKSAMAISAGLALRA